MFLSEHQEVAVGVCVVVGAGVSVVVGASVVVVAGGFSVELNFQSQLPTYKQD